jgi:hypothetical protein
MTSTVELLFWTLSAVISGTGRMLPACIGRCLVLIFDGTPATLAEVLKVNSRMLP